MIMKCRVQSPEQAVLYLTDCTLATVSNLASKKTRSNYEYRRQISIAQTGFDWLVGYHEIIESDHKSRVKDVHNFYNGSVAEWAKKYEH